MQLVDDSRKVFPQENLNSTRPNVLDLFEQEKSPADQNSIVNSTSSSIFESFGIQLPMNPVQINNLMGVLSPPIASTTAQFGALPPMSNKSAAQSASSPIIKEHSNSPENLRIFRDGNTCAAADSTAEVASVYSRLETEETLLALEDRIRYRCTGCDRGFALKRDLITHQRTCVHGEQTHKCDECGKEFGTRQLLKKHTMWHSGERAHKCPNCGKAFFQKGHLTQHMMIHSHERPFACLLCPKTFIFKFDLNRHMKTHSEQAPLAKDECIQRPTKRKRSKRDASKMIPEESPCDPGSETEAEDSTSAKHNRSSISQFQQDIIHSTQQRTFATDHHDLLKSFTENKLGIAQQQQSESQMKSQKDLRGDGGLFVHQMMQLLMAGGAATGGGLPILPVFNPAPLHQMTPQFQQHTSNNASHVFTANNMLHPSIGELPSIVNTTMAASKLSVDRLLLQLLLNNNVNSHPVNELLEMLERRNINQIANTSPTAGTTSVVASSTVSPGSSASSPSKSSVIEPPSQPMFTQLHQRVLTNTSPLATNCFECEKSRQKILETEKKLAETLELVNRLRTALITLHRHQDQQQRLPYFTLPFTSQQKNYDNHAATMLTQLSEHLLPTKQAIGGGKT